MATIRSAGIHGFGPVVRDLGGDPVAFLDAVGIPAEALTEEDLPMQDWRFAEALESAARELGCPDLGLRVAEHHGIEMLGPLAMVLLNSPTAGDALEATTRYLGFHAAAIHVDVVPDPQGDPDVVGIRYRGHGGGPPPPQAMDAGFGFLHRAARFLLGEDHALISVELGYTSAAPPERLAAFFGAPVAADRLTTCLRVPAHLPSSPIGGDAVVRQFAVDRIEQLLADSTSEDWIGRTRIVVADLLGYGRAELVDVAHVLALHPRTLQRRLAAEQATFAEIVDDVRRQTCHHHLVHADLPVGQIAALVGFAEQASLSRSARRWWGMSPRAVRHAAR